MRRPYRAIGRRRHATPAVNLGEANLGVTADGHPVVTGVRGHTGALGSDDSADDIAVHCSAEDSHAVAVGRNGTGRTLGKAAVNHA